MIKDRSARLCRFYKGDSRLKEQKDKKICSYVLMSKKKKNNGIISNSIGGGRIL